MIPYSVLISVYAKEDSECLKASLLSMMNQTLPPQEIVLVEDGPLTDALNRVIEDLCQKNTNLFKVISLPNNQGLGPALNKGLSACSNEWVVRMDSDDISRENRVEKQLSYIQEHPETDVCGSWIQEFDNLSKKTMGIRKVPETSKEIYQYMKTRCPFNHMSVVLKKSAVLAAGNYQSFHYNEDYLLWISMAVNRCVFHNLPEVLVDVRSDRNLYSRRGGKEYYESEKKIQMIMKEKGMISNRLYRSNVAKRFILQRVCPNWLRQFIYEHFARTKGEE